MRILLDESMPKKLGRELSNHVIKTVPEMGWSGVKNGKLLTLAAMDFDVFVTVDKNLQHQQNLAKLPISVIVLDAKSNELCYLLPLIPKLKQQIETMQPKTLVRIT